MPLTLKSERQIQGEILGRLIAQLGINDVNPGSVIDVLTQAVSQQDFALYYQLAQISRLVNLDALAGNDLDNKGFEYGLTRFQPVKSSGPVSVLRPAGFQKVSTNFYAGSLSPIAGQTTIDVNDASNSLIGSSGTLIIGRGGNSEEEVSYAVAPVNMLTFWRYTLSSPLVFDHIVEETVILKQGVDQPISAGTVIAVPASGTTAEIDFQTDADTVLLAGEEEVDNVRIVAQQAGSSGNIPIGAINGTLAFPNPPFPGAQAENTIKFTTGQDLESDDDFRDRIKSAIQALTRAVKQALLTAIIGLVDPVTAKRVVSASVILPVNTAQDVYIYIDDGTGFEPSFEDVGFEDIIDSATGGEQRLQLAEFPVVKAQIQNNVPQYYDMSAVPLNFVYQVGVVQEIITFTETDFLNPETATAFEIVDAINSKGTIIEARTAQDGTYVLVNSKSDTNDNIQIIGGTANAILQFNTDPKQTLSLYIDDVLKSKDGITAILDSTNTAPYDLLALGAYPHTLSMIVDGKSNTQIATVNHADVANPSAVTAQEIANCINRDISGVLAFPIDINTKVRIQSLTILSANSKLQVTGGDANASVNGVNFPTTQVVGINNDYTFNRETGAIQLNVPLVANQNVTANSLFTRAKLRVVSPELYVIPTGLTLILSVDGGALQTVTFDNTFAGGGTAAAVATYLNQSLLGATALFRTIGGINYLEINTNTYATSGSLLISSTSTSNVIFNFPVDTTVTSNVPNRAYLVSGSVGPYQFAQNDSLVVVLDNDIVNNTFSINTFYPGNVTAATDGSDFSDSALNGVFKTQNEIENYYIAFLSGLNTDNTGVLGSVSLLGSGVARYGYTANPTNFGNFAVGDLIGFSLFSDSENNGFFVIANIGSNYVDVQNANAVVAAGETASNVLSQKRLITSYNQLTGAIVTSTAFSNTPVVGDSLIVLPSTVSNLVDFINNKRITSFSLKGTVEGVNNNQNLQLSSQSNGSDGSIQITGGNANTKLNFTTKIFNGIQAYGHWTGLLELVNKTIYGDDTDLTSFPGYGAAGIIFHILAPTVEQINVQLSVTTANNVTISAIENDIKSAVDQYVNNLGLGEDVIIEQIRAGVIAIPGVTDVSVLIPAANVPIADNQKAALSTNNITIG